MSSVQRKTPMKGIDYLKIVENVVRKAGEINLMCLNVFSREKKTNNPL